MRFPIYFSLVFSMLVVSSCGTPSKTPEQLRQDSLKQAAIDDSLFLVKQRKQEEAALSECQQMGPNQFCDYGLDFIAIGDSVTWKKFDVEGAVQVDTVFEEAILDTDPPEMADWNATLIKFNDGNVVLETDTESDLFLSRVRIETPRYTNAKGLHVGMTFAELQQAEPELVVRSFIAKNLVEVIAHNKIILHLENNGYFDPKGEGVIIPAEKINPAEKVIRIVLL